MAIENKVLQSSLWSLGSSIVLAILNAANDSTLIAALPPLAQFVIVAAVVPGFTFLAGYIAQHTPRPDLYAYLPPQEGWQPQPPQIATSAAPVADPVYEREPVPGWDYDNTQEWDRVPAAPLFTHQSQYAPAPPRQPAPRPGRHQAPHRP